ncbi:MAG: hypothetical protein H0W88_01585 [Parachlamydiaceae bacterium]|nr:hypothetical protein [Parachlamydiaceae bacterium]
MLMNQLNKWIFAASMTMAACIGAADTFHQACEASFEGRISPFERSRLVNREFKRTLGNYIIDFHGYTLNVIFNNILNNQPEVNNALTQKLNEEITEISNTFLERTPNQVLSFNYFSALEYYFSSGLNYLVAQAPNGNIHSLPALESAWFDAANAIGVFLVNLDKKLTQPEIDALYLHLRLLTKAQIDVIKALNPTPSNDPDYIPVNSDFPAAIAAYDIARNQSIKLANQIFIISNQIADSN